MKRTPAKALLFFLVAVIAFAAGAFFATRRMLGEADVLDRYHRWYYEQRIRTWDNTRWFGHLTEKLPLDMWVFQEVMAETKPTLLIETGTYRGGSAIFFANMFDLLGKGRVITVDIEEQPGRPTHPRIQYLLGSSTTKDILVQLKNASKGEAVMVTLDSDHHRDHVSRELQLYSDLVSVGQYLVVEDTDINGHPVLGEFGPGPWEAVREFLKNDSRFVVDRTREKYGVSQNPGGWLKRVR